MRVIDLGTVESDVEASSNSWNIKSSLSCLDGLLDKYEDVAVLNELVASLLLSEDTLSRLALRSFLHPTGIFKLVLAESAYSNIGMRLHIWKNGNAYPENTNYDSVHNHRWDFVSKIVVGEFRKCLFRKDISEGVEYSKFLFFGADQNRLNLTQASGTEKLYSYFSATLSGGTRYSQTSEVLHLIEPISNSFSATLFIRSPYYSDQTEVYLPGRRKLVGLQEKTKNFLTIEDTRLLLMMLQDFMCQR